MPASPQIVPVDLEATLQAQGFAFVEGSAMRPWLERAGALDDWDDFARSWDDLHLDTHMGDGGRYRRRRHAVFHAVRGAEPERQPHQPHWQSLDYNPLNGGIARWFEPVADATANGSSLSTILRWGRQLCDDLAPQTQTWRIEVHQFRIEASLDAPGRPTPEGMHRDGVDFVLVLLVNRRNIREGTTSILALDGAPLGSFTLTLPFDAAIVEDSRVFHGVTAVEPIDAALPACRDVLVVTYRRS